MQDIVARALPADTQVVVGGATGRWLTSPEERFTDRLMRAGRRVIFVAATIIAAMAVATNARAQTPRPSSDDVLRRIAALEAAVAALNADVEGGRAAAASDGEKAAAQDRAPSDTVTYGVALDTYYGYNFNRPIGRINLLRAYDVKSNNFSLNQANVVVESAPNLDAGRRFGGRLDLQYGQATETLQGSLVNEPRPWVYRNIFQAYGTYVLPVGSGLTIDFGKWASSLGFENNYSKDQINYSRSYLFNFLPFYHMGARVTYRFNDAVAVNYWTTNGTQQTEAFNDFKDQFVGVVLQPSKSVTW